jgi:hypothetical protein
MMPPAVFFSSSTLTTKILSFIGLIFMTAFLLRGKDLGDLIEKFFGVSNKFFAGNLRSRLSLLHSDYIIFIIYFRNLNGRPHQISCRN